MTKQKHVKEPWIFQNLPQGILIQNDNSEIADVIWEHDAKRIVECVNACAGIENPLDLRHQRDELREALERIVLKTEEKGRNPEMLIGEIRYFASEALTKTKGDVC